MGFALITPVMKPKSGTFKIATVRMRKGGDYRLQLTIPSTEFTKVFGAAEKIDIFWGDGPDEGKLLLAANPAGLFKPTGLKNCFVIRLPVTDETPQIDLDFESPERRDNGKGELTVDLPEWAYVPGRWQEIQSARNTAGKQNKAAASVAARQPGVAGQALLSSSANGKRG